MKHIDSMALLRSLCELFSLPKATRSVTINVSVDRGVMVTAELVGKGDAGQIVQTIETHVIDEPE